MLNNFGDDYRAAGTAYCGLEAKLTAPNGNVEYLYVADGFDDAWIREPGSVGEFASSLFSFQFLVIKVD